MVVSITSQNGRGMEFRCNSASVVGPIVIARWESANSSDAKDALNSCSSERGLVVASDFSEDSTLAVIRLSESSVDFSS